MFKNLIKFFTNLSKSEFEISNETPLKDRFKTKEEVYGFIGKDIEEKYNEIIEKWFMIVDKKDIINNESVYDYYILIKEQFNLFIESLFVTYNCSIPSDDEKIRLILFLDDFKVILNSFEKFIYTSTTNKIINTGNKRNKLKV